MIGEGVLDLVVPHIKSLRALHAYLGCENDMGSGFSLNGGLKRSLRVTLFSKCVNYGDRFLCTK